MSGAEGIVVMNGIFGGEVLRILREFGVAIVAGEAGLNNKITGISVLEIARQEDCWFLGNELILSTLHMFSTPDEIADVVSMLASRGVSALGVHQIVSEAFMDPRVLRRADELAFPLLSIPSRMPYSTIFTRVYERIFDGRADALSEADEKSRGDFYNDLLSGAIQSEEILSARAVRLGVPIAGDHHVLAVRADVPGGGAKGPATEETLEEIARAACEAVHRRSAVLPADGGAVIILRFDERSERRIRRSAIDSLCHAIRDESLARGARVTIGVGDACGSLLDIAQSCRQALRAISLGRKISGGGLAFHFGEMGVYSLLDDMEGFRPNCARELERLRAAYGKNAESHFETLEAFFDSGESASATAKALNIHVNTVKYRIRRSREILGDEAIDDGQERLKLYLLLKMRKLIP
jgi:sugar diacid utilization regulator